MDGRFGDVSNEREMVRNSSQSDFLNTYVINKKDRKKTTLFSTYFTNCFYIHFAMSNIDISNTMDMLK